MTHDIVFKLWFLRNLFPYVLVSVLLFAHIEGFSVSNLRDPKCFGKFFFAFWIFACTFCCASFFYLILVPVKEIVFRKSENCVCSQPTICQRPANLREHACCACNILHVCTSILPGLNELQEDKTPITGLTIGVADILMPKEPYILALQP